MCHLSRDAILRAHTRVLLVDDALGDHKNNTRAKVRQMCEHYPKQNADLANIIGNEEANCKLFAQKLCNLKGYLG